MIHSIRIWIVIVRPIRWVVAALMIPVAQAIVIWVAVVRTWGRIMVSMPHVVESYSSWPHVLVKFFEVIIGERGILFAVLID
jgi:hypothetical protein